MQDFLMLPGLIDCHVHFREPGFPQKGTMVSEAEAALAGGITTVCEMPNTNPPTTTVEALQDKVKRAAKVQSCDIRFFFGVTEQAHLREFERLLTDASLRIYRERCPGVKLYFDHSTGNQRVNEEVTEDVFRVCAEQSVPLVAHCEDTTVNAKAREKVQQEFSHPPVSFHSLMRPSESETTAITHAISLARKHGTHLHIAHISTERGLTIVHEAKKEGLPITCEVAPHHLFLTTDDYEVLGTLAKMNPPLRSVEDRDALWRGITDGTIDCIATDHAPHTLEEKQCDNPLDAPNGVLGVETLLPLLFTVASGQWPHHSSQRPAASRGFSVEGVTRLCFENPNRIFRLGRKSIEEEAKENPVFVDPNEEWVIRGGNLHSKCKWTPYEGWKVKGRVKSVSILLQ
ncbi:hypothetical protein A2635_05000 [Candidatus Peribacteria bacterium RIFCSPHIGHO2_01_FULL_51_9]|nr:MAG: hypothetical protein A2635_05000 [Candidatus Peribacteria bacterium RIFCSPHIGHO2_01_FULL_51_9]